MNTYKAITFIYLASIVFIFVRFPSYTGVVLTTMLFWLSVRGVVYEKFLVGASLPFIPVQGKGVRILSVITLLISLGFHYLLLTALQLNLLAVVVIFVYIPAVMWVGTYLKRNQTSEKL